VKPGLLLFSQRRTLFKKLNFASFQLGLQIVNF